MTKSTPPSDEGSHEAHYETTDTYPPMETTDLLGATQLLARKVRILTEHLSVSQDAAARIERQAHRTKFLTRIVLGLTFLSLAGVVTTAILLSQVQESVSANKANQVTNCQNANDARQGSRQLWNFLIGTSMANDTQTPQSMALLSDLKDYVNTVYQPHDCSDLSKKYPVPTPPPITQLGTNGAHGRPAG